MDRLNNVLSPAIVHKEQHIDCTDDLDTLYNKVCQVKDEVVQYGINPSANYDFIRPEILRSWERSKKYGVNYYQLGYPCLDQNSLSRLIAMKQQLITAAEAYLGQLHKILSCTNCYAILTDEEGVAISVLFRNQSHREPYRVEKGIIINEKTIGTCSHALSILHKVPFQLWGPEHYCQNLHHTVGSSAPIFDPLGNLAGTLTIISDNDSHQFVHTLGFVLAMAWSIQERFQLAFQDNFLNVILESMDLGLVTLNKEGTIIKVNAEAQEQLGYDQRLVNESIERVWGEQPQIKSVLASGQSLNDVEIIADITGNRKLYCDLYPIKDRFNNIYGCIVKIKANECSRKLKKATIENEYRCFTFDKIIGTCEPMALQIKKAEKMAQTDVNILIQGESGVGKDVFAQAIHHSSRPSGPYVTVNCAAIPRDLIESELFGYESGAFTGADRGGKRGKFELANGGTLFLDEIGDMPLDVQPVLLRVLEEKRVVRLGSSKSIPVNFRLIAATNQNLLELVQQSRFRLDLYYRLSVFTITIPPLRERNEDILLLAQAFVRKASKRLGIKEPVLSDKVKLLLLQYSWPGNVRQLENAILYAVHMCRGGVIWPYDLPDDLQCNELAAPVGQTIAPVKQNAEDAKLNLQIKELEIISIKQSLESTGYNISKTAKLLGLSKSTVYRRIREYNLMN